LLPTLPEPAIHAAFRDTTPSPLPAVCGAGPGSAAQSWRTADDGSSEPLGIAPPQIRRCASESGTDGPPSLALWPSPAALPPTPVTPPTAQSVPSLRETAPASSCAHTSRTPSAPPEFAVASAFSARLTPYTLSLWIGEVFRGSLGALEAVAAFAFAGYSFGDFQEGAGGVRQVGVFAVDEAQFAFQLKFADRDADQFAPG